MRDEKIRAAQKEATTRWRTKNPEKVRAKKRAAYARMTVEQRAAERARLRQWGVENRNKVREHGWRKQGLPSPTSARPENCDSCGRPEWLETRAFALDHDHITGKFRGWLCWHCNTGLGLFGDSVEGLEKALAYLKRAL
jgi:hypothetical protein